MVIESSSGDALKELEPIDFTGIDEGAVMREVRKRMSAELEAAKLAAIDEQERLGIEDEDVGKIMGALRTIAELTHEESEMFNFLASQSNDINLKAHAIAAEIVAQKRGGQTGA